VNHPDFRIADYPAFYASHQTAILTKFAALVCRPWGCGSALDPDLLKARAFVLFLTALTPLKVYKGYSHGMALTHADVINADLLAFIRG